MKKTKVKKEITGFVTIDKTPMTEDERKKRIAQFFVLLYRWKLEEAVVRVQKKERKTNEIQESCKTNSFQYL